MNEVIPKYVEELKNKPNYHFLTEDDFKDIPQDFNKWESPKKYPAKIKRVDYASFLVMSFGISRGQPLVQKMYTTLLLYRTGFDGFISNSAFDKVGAFEVLSKEEREFLSSSFESVEGHRYAWPRSKYSPMDVIRLELHRNLPYLYQEENHSFLELLTFYQIDDEEVWRLLGKTVDQERQLKFYRQYY